MPGKIDLALTLSVPHFQPKKLVGKRPPEENKDHKTDNLLI